MLLSHYFLALRLSFHFLQILQLASNSIESIEIESIAQMLTTINDQKRYKHNRPEFHIDAGEGSAEGQVWGPWASSNSWKSDATTGGSWHE
jgi:hypothetical protein